MHTYRARTILSKQPTTWPFNWIAVARVTVFWHQRGKIEANFLCSLIFNVVHLFTLIDPLTISAARWYTIASSYRRIQERRRGDAVEEFQTNHKIDTYTSIGSLKAARRPKKKKKEDWNMSVRFRTLSQNRSQQTKKLFYTQKIRKQKKALSMSQLI